MLCELCINVQHKQIERSHAAWLLLMFVQVAPALKAVFETGTAAVTV